MTTAHDKNLGAATQVTTWQIDPAASRAEFSVRMLLMFLANITVKGGFSDVRGTLTGDERNPTNAQISVTIGAASLDTRNAARDKHLRSADFFEIDTYPTLTFASQRIEALDQLKGHYRVTGLLTIRDVACEVSLDAQYTPQEAGRQRHGFDLTTRLNRRDFGLVWSRPQQKIADDVSISLHIELVPA